MRWQPCNEWQPQCNELLQRCILAGLFSDPQDCIAPVQVLESNLCCFLDLAIRFFSQILAVLATERANYFC